jgi:hypothetical protein
MISHETLYNLANGLGSTAVLLAVAYHFLAVNAKELSRASVGNVSSAKEQQEKP